MNTKQPPPARVTTLTLRLPPEIAERLRRLAQTHDRSLNGEIVRALREYVDRERQEREQEGRRNDDRTM